MMDQIDKHQIAVWFAKDANAKDCYRAFEAYGHAMAAAAAFEYLMALMIMKAMALRLGKRAGTNIQPEDRPRLIRALLNSTYEHLRQKICKSFHLSEALRIGLADGKEARDNLAHNFWQAHAGNLLSSEGVDVIATVCAAHANHFRLLALALFEETGVDASDYLKMLRDASDRIAKIEGWQQILCEQKLV